MNTFTYSVSLVVEVEAFDSSDAMDILNDTLGPGEDCGVYIKSLEVLNEHPSTT